MARFLEFFCATNPFNIFSSVKWQKNKQASYCFILNNPKAVFQFLSADFSNIQYAHQSFA